MGKRKKAAKKPTGPRKNEPLPTAFPCLFCNHEKSVTVKLDKKAGVGQLSCKVCDQNFQCSVNYLSAAVDVYSDWVDACDTVAKEHTGDAKLGSSRQMGMGRAGDRDRERESDNDIIDDDDDDDGAAGYGGDGIIADDEY